MDPNPMSKLALQTYRLAARMAGMALCRIPIVESVYANRGVGRGEVAFGRSDIDLSVITRVPDPETGDGRELYSLYRRVCLLRRINPALSHLMVYDPVGIDRWMRTDTYLGSQERRSMFFLAGRPTRTPDIPVRREDAIRWVAFWNDRFFPLAVQQRNRRNLRKIAIEVWKSWTVAEGVVAEPYLTLREAAQKARSHPIGAALANAVGDPRSATAFIMKISGILHDELFAPLKKMKEPLVLRMSLPPRSRQRVIVVLPHPGCALPEAAFESQSLLATPELLHLYLHYFNPFLDWTLPVELRTLGFTAPSPHEYVRACLFYGQDNIWRMPGFVRPDTWLPHAVLAFNRYSVPYLRNGEVPPPMPGEVVQAALAHLPTIADYYLRDYARLYRQSLDQLKILEELEAPGIYPAREDTPKNDHK
jgi:hypothetical protein